MSETPDELEARMDAALAPFGWECGPDFWKRYHTDPWVFNLANAVERVTIQRDALLARLATAEAERGLYETIARTYRAEHSLYCTCEPCIARDEILHAVARREQP